MCLEDRHEEHVVVGPGADLLGEKRPLLDRETIDLALVGVLWGGLILFAGRLPACKARECRFLAGDGITTSSLRGTEERVIGVVEDLLGRLSLALAATLFALAASLLALFARISRTDRALPLGLSLSWLAARR